jgi:rhamnose utilization protein RhaD (predicted bifunctional aldolase and dehydrogenase)
MTSSGWNEAEAARLVAATRSDADRDLILRLYSCRLIGGDRDLVLHGGGNTSVKVRRNRADGTPVEVMHVKGSGHDLANIDASGMPAVYLQPLEAYRRLDALDDLEMVAGLRRNLVDPSAPTPSIEALLHAYLPGKYVDHTPRDRCPRRGQPTRCSRAREPHLRRSSCGHPLCHAGV